MRTISFRPVRSLLPGLLLFVVSLAVFGAILFAAPGFMGTDDYYHARISQQIVEQRRLAVDFTWLPYTLLSPDRYVDHHLLFHLYLAPWVSLDEMAGAKLAVATIAALNVVMVWVLLRSLQVKLPALWALGLLGVSTPFISRMLMVRTQGASLLLLLIALYLLLHKHYRWLLVLAFLYAWLYNGFVLILAFAALYTLATWITERTFDWQPVIYTTVGLALGLIINPYFPRNFQFIAEHLGAKISFESGVRVGNEWYPYQTGTLLTNSAGALLALTLGVLRPGVGGKRDRIATTLLLVALLTLYMVFKSRRFIEYFPAFALLFCAVSWGRDTAALATLLPGPLSRQRLAATLGTISLTAIILLFGGLTISDAYTRSLDRKPVSLFAGASAWLAEHAPAGATVFQTDWDDFPRLFFYNPGNTYIAGLDPTYLERADPALWTTWRAITRGEVAAPSAEIFSTFGAQFVVSDTRHGDFAAQADADPAMRMVYRDSDSIVWEILPEVLARANQP
ncbi:MAG: hypothetical protein Kow0077_02940 [Anaerolineae bacterium]